MQVRRIPLYVAGAVVLTLAAFLRFDSLGVPSYWLDEILGQVLLSKAIGMPWWSWFTGVHPQHGPLYYALQFAARGLGDSEWAGRMPAALLGFSAVPLLWLAARRYTGDGIAAAASAALLAASPLHVYYSREARPYALLVLLVVVLLLAIDRASVRQAGLILVLLLYASIGSAPVMIACALTLLGAIPFVAKDRRPVLRRMALCAGVALGGFLVLYRLGGGRESEGFPGLGFELFDHIARGLSVTAIDSPDGGRSAYGILLLAVGGAVALARRNRSAAALIVGMTVLPAAISILSLRIGDHFFAIRYVLASLPGYLLLAGVGIAAVARLAAARFATVVASAIVAVLVVQMLPAARTEAYRKLDWRSIASLVWSHAQQDDYVLAAEPWSEVSLGYYLDRLPPKVRLRYMAGTGIAQIVVDNAGGPVWLVTAGSTNDRAVRDWMCRYPLLLASELEGFRLHYAPTTAHFLEHRAGPAERRALAAAVGSGPLHIAMDSANELLFGEGWADPEQFGPSTMRWVSARRAVVSLPRPEREDAVLRFRAIPMSHPTLPPQTVQVLLNGRPLAEIVMTAGWSEYAVEAPGSLWNGAVNLLELRFGHAVAPASVDPAAADRRTLAAAFEWIAVTSPNDRRLEVEPQLMSGRMRLGADVYLDASALWRNTESRFPAHRLRRGHVQSLLGRLGYDPAAAWPPLASGDVNLDDVVETLAFDGPCLDDEAFARHAFTVLMGRPPGAPEQAVLTASLRSGVSRRVLVGRMAKMADFRRMMLDPEV